MRMIKIQITLAVFLPFFNLAFAQDTTKPFYFPHKTGDMWEYYYYDGPMSVDTFQVFTIFDSTDFNGVIYLKKYAGAINPDEPTYFFQDTTVYLLDTTKNYVWILEQTDSSLIYKLNANKGEQWVAFNYVRLGGTDYDMARITDKWQGMLFNKPTTFMNIYYYIAHDSTDTIGVADLGFNVIADGFGLISIGGGDFPGEIHLIGAVISDTLYGDTTVVSVTDKKTIPPSTIKLYPNYPNPFNPSTIISFELTNSSNITLIIYNILGKEIKRLVDSEEYLNGSYKIKWDGTENNGEKAASGIYFYRLITNKMSLTHSMILLK